MLKKAEAYKEYREAAMIEMLLDTLPKVKFVISVLIKIKIKYLLSAIKVAAEVAAPLSQTKKITMVSSGDGQVGAAKLTGEVLSIVGRIPELVKQMTNIDISRVNQNHKYI
jgi:flotillin